MIYLRKTRIFVLELFETMEKQSRAKKFACFQIITYSTFPVV